jgi:putative intracellular protease/amidase
MIYNNNRGCVGAICHGTIGLAYANSNGKRIIDGKFIATFTNEEERELRLDGTLPVLCESILDREGAICIPSPPW